MIDFMYGALYTDIFKSLPIHITLDVCLNLFRESVSANIHVLLLSFTNIINIYKRNTKMNLFRYFCP